MERPLTPQTWRRDDAERAPDARVGVGRRWSAAHAWLAAALALVAVAYFPITRNFFNGDDFFHLYFIVNKSLLQFLLYMQGAHLLMTRNLVFRLSFAIFGTNAAAYFWIVLATHLFNVFLLFRIVHGLTDSARLACFGAALWGILPVQEGTLGWYSVYGHALVATCTLLVLWGLVRATNGAPTSRWAPLGWTLLLLAGATSFGVGIGVAFAMPLVVWCLLPPAPLRRRTFTAFLVLALLLPVIYAGAENLYATLYGRLPTSRLLIALLWEWHLHVVLFAQLIAYGVSCVVLGVLQRPSFYPGPIAVAAVVMYAALLLLVLTRGAAALRWRIAACLAICAGGYSVIAAGRGGFTGAAGAANMAEMARFHYVGTAVLALALCLAMAQLAQWWPWRPAAASALLVGWLSLSALGQYFFGTPIRHFDNARWETGRALAQIRSAARSMPGNGDVYIENQMFLSVGPLLAASRAAFPGWAALYTIYSSDDTVDGRRVRFVESDHAALEAARDDRRTAALLVAPENAPAEVYQPPPPTWRGAPE